MAENNTIDAYLDSFEGGVLDSFNAQSSIQSIKSIVGYITVNGEYDANIVSTRLGQFIYAILECSKVLASLGLVRDFQDTETDKEFANAALIRAVEKGYTTDGKAKLYAQTDDLYIEKKNKLNTIEATIEYIEGCSKSLNLAQLHCKKIMDRDKTESSFAGDHERLGGGNNGQIKWMKE